MSMDNRMDGDNKAAVLITATIAALLATLILSILAYNQASEARDHDLKRSAITAGLCQTSVAGTSELAWQPCPRGKE